MTETGDCGCIFCCQIKDLHPFSMNNQQAIGESTKCGCFYCCETYPASQVKEYVTGETTALCPKCGVDAVLPDSQVTLTHEILRTMHARWFCQGKRE